MEGEGYLAFRAAIAEIGTTRISAIMDIIREYGKSEKQEDVYLCYLASVAATKYVEEIFKCFHVDDRMIPLFSLTHDDGDAYQPIVIDIMKRLEAEIALFGGPAYDYPDDHFERKFNGED